MTIHLYSHRCWTDEDSYIFLDDPKALGIDPKAFKGCVVYIANGCRDGQLLADVIEALHRYGATMVQLGTLKERAGALRVIAPPEKN